MYKRKIFIYTIILALSIGFLVLSFAQADNSSIEKAIDYVKSQPQSTWSVMALAAANADNIDASFLKNPPQNSTALEYSKYILALAALGENPTKFGSENYVQKLEGFYDSGTLQFGDINLINDDIWAILALGSLGKENSYKVQNSKIFILQNQNQDGGWGYAVGSSSDTNDTAVAIMALLEAGLPSSSDKISNAVNYLKSAQNEDGGFGYDPNSEWGKDSDSASDAWIVSAIYRLDQDPTSTDWTKNGKNAIDHIKFLQDSDGGIWWQDPAQNPSFNNKAKTADCLIALSSKFFPVYSKYNKHFLRIEGENNTVCQTEINGATPMDLVINGSKACNYNYAVSNQWEDSMGLFLQKISDVEGWWIYANNTSLMVSAADYYLMPSEEVLLNYIGQDYSTLWEITKVEVIKSQELAVITAKYFDSEQNSWQDLKIAGIKIKISEMELVTDDLGKIEINLNDFQSGDYSVFIERQILDGNGYIKSKEVNLYIGEDSSNSNRVGLKVEIDGSGTTPPPTEDTISFSVSPDLLDFGKIKRGENSVQGVKITNNGVAIYLESEVVGSGIFQENIQINQDFWQSFSTEVEKDQEKDLNVELVIPSDYNGDSGIKEGELIFWATKK